MKVTANVMSILKSAQVVLYNKYLEKEDPKVSPNKLLFLVTAVKMMIGHRFGRDEIMSVVWQAENFYSFPL